MRVFSVSAYVVFQGRVLLGLHSRLGLWLPIGGKLEGDETPLEALQREVQEELGWYPENYTLPQIDSVSPPGFMTYEEHPVDKGGLHLNFAFVLRARQQTFRRSSEFQDMMWTPSPWGIGCPDNVVHLVTRALSVG